MVSLEFAEYHYFDDVLSDLKLTPVSLILISYLFICGHEFFRK